MQCFGLRRENGVIDLVHDAAVPDDEKSITEADGLLDVRGDEQLARPLVGEGSQEPVQFQARPDVDAPGGLLEDQHLGFHRQPAPDEDLLLISTRQFPDGLRQAPGTQLDLLGQAGRRRGLLPAPDHAQPRESPQDGE
jgi:hypothetical protein